MLAGGGGTEAQHSTEIVPDDHDQDLDVTERVGLKHGRAGHCSMGHSGEYGNAAKLVGKMSKSVMQLISIYF